MTQGVEFRLPGDENPRKTPAGRGGPAAIVAGICVVLLVVLLGLELAGRRFGSGAGRAARGYDAEELARKLEGRGLPRAAAQAWEESLEAGRLPAHERAMRYFRIGKLYRKAGDDEQALAFFARSELVERVPEITGEMDRLRAECYRRLGNLTGLASDIRERTSLPGEDVATGSVVVAEIGAEKITLDDLDRRIEQAVDGQLHALRGRIPADRLEAEKKRILAQLRSGEAKGRLLDELVSREILWREALERGLARDPATDRTLEDLRKEFLASRVIDAEIADRVSVAESDLRDRYEANLDRYRIPEGLRLRRIVCPSEARAREALDALHAGRAFEACVAEFSEDGADGPKDGAVPGTVLKGAPIPGMPDDPALASRLFSLEAGEPSDPPIESGGRWYVFEVVAKIPERVRPFDEVRDEIEGEKRAEKEKEAVDALLARLREKYGVTVYRNRLAGEVPAAGAGEEGGDR